MRIASKYLVGILVFYASVFLSVSADGQGEAKNLSGFNFGANSGLRYFPKDDIIKTNYLRDSTYVFLSDSEIDSDWNLRDKFIYSYDNQGRVLESVHSKLSDSVEWINESRLRNTYSDDQFLISQEEDSWEPKAGKWSSSLLRTYSYNVLGLEDLIITEKYFENLWQLDSKVEYSYNSAYDITEEVAYSRNYDEQYWEAVSRYLYTYFENENIQQEIYQLWDDSVNKWVNQASKQYKYNNSNKLISTTKSNWDSNNKDWVDLSVISLLYNEKGQILSSNQMHYSAGINNGVPIQSQESKYDNNGNIGQEINSVWNSDSESWNLYQKQIHFWTKYVNGNLHQGDDNIVCLFENPYIVGLPWYCESLKANVDYTVEVFDLFGRKFYSDTFTNKSSFRITQSIPDGFYIVLIRGGLDYHSEKILIRN